MRCLPQLQSERLVLRPFTMGDVDGLHGLWTAPEVRRYLWDDVVIPWELAEEVVASLVASAETDGIGCWVIEVGDALVGFCGFRRIEEGREIELLYGLRREHWGKGLATEACRLAMEYLWEATDVERVYARTDPPNDKSIEVMVRLGMTPVSRTDKMISYVCEREGLEL